MIWLTKIGYTLAVPASSTGHCGGDPSNDNLFDDTGNVHLDCTLTNFEQAPIAERLLWIEQFASQNRLGNWFKNIEGIIEAFVHVGLSDPGTWLSSVDAAILHGIQDGFVGRTSVNSGASEWTKFFDEYYKNSANPELGSLWGAAEQEATDYGVRWAEVKGLAPNGAETIFLATGDIYRGGHTDLWWVGSLWRFGPLSVYGGYKLGTWFNDPRSVDPVFGRSPVYWYSRGLWWITDHAD